MHRTVSIALTVAAALLTSTSVPAQRDSAAAPATVQEVMTAMTVPASDVIFAAASDPPDTGEAWAALRQAAVTLAASGRLLERGELARDTTAWMDMARALVREAEATMAMAERKARDRLEQASDKVYATCGPCHARYLDQAR